MSGASWRARLRGVLGKVVTTLGRRAPDADMDEEMRFHLDMLAERYVRSGSSPSEARRAALIEFGGRERWREAGRDERRSRILEDLGRDVRYAFASLRRRPTFAATTILTIALGIAASVAVFTIGNSVFLRPLSVPGADRLVRIHFLSARARYEGILGYQGTRYVAGHARTVDHVAAHYSTAPFYVGLGDTRREMQGAVVSASYFPLLGLQPQLGRFFAPAEDSVPDRDAVAVISDALWRADFGAEPNVLGRTIVINRQAFTIVGVAPAGFHGVLPGSTPNEIWIPAMMFRIGYRWCDALDVSAHCGVGEALAHLAPNRTVAEARAEIGAMTRPLVDLNDPSDSMRVATVELATGFDAVNQRSFAALVQLLSGIAAMLLVLSCANVAGLLLARGIARTREIAVRASLGAARDRIVRQLLAESLVLGATGGVVGVALSVGMAHGLMGAFASDSEGYAHYFDLGIDGRVLAFAALASLITVVLFGLLPAVESARADPATLIKRGGSGGLNRSRLRTGLVAAQVALSLVLLTGAVLLSRSFSYVTGNDMVDSGHVSLVRLRPRLVGYAPDRAQRFLRAVIRRLRELPDVQSVALARGVGSVWESSGSLPLSLPGEAPRSADKQTLIEYHEVTPDFFATLRVPLLHGRDFDVGDSVGTPPVAIVNQALARRLWAQTSAVGRSLVLGGKSFRVVGEVADHRLHDAGEAPVAMAFVAFWQNAFEPQIDARGAIRVRGDPASALPALQRAIATVDASVPVTEVLPMRAQVAGTYSLVHAAASVATAAAAIALFLAAVGLYSIMAFIVAASTRDIGIRLAVGADPRRLTAFYVRQGLTTTTIGATMGLVAALLAARVLASWLFGVRMLDPIAFVIAATAVGVACLLAAYLPARRAARVDPLVALRAE